MVRLTSRQAAEHVSNLPTRREDSAAPTALAERIEQARGSQVHRLLLNLRCRRLFLPRELLHLLARANPDLGQILANLPALSSFALTSLHGDLPPRVRETALNAFTSHPSSHLSPAVLLCTDVASRGVDFADVDVVLQYDPPTDPKTFSHRAGRTARAGRKGKAVTLLGRGREEDYIGKSRCSAECA